MFKIGKSRQTGPMHLVLVLATARKKTAQREKWEAEGIRMKLVKSPSKVHPFLWRHENLKLTVFPWLLGWWVLHFLPF